MFLFKFKKIHKTNLKGLIFPINTAEEGSVFTELIKYCNDTVLN